MNNFFKLFLACFSCFTATALAQTNDWGAPIAKSAAAYPQDKPTSPRPHVVTSDGSGTAAPVKRVETYPVEWQVEEVDERTGESTITTVGAGQVAAALKTPGVTCSVDEENISTAFDRTVGSKGYIHSRSMYCQLQTPKPLPGIPAPAHPERIFQKVTTFCHDMVLGGDFESVDWLAKTPDHKPLVTVRLSCDSRKP